MSLSGKSSFSRSTSEAITLASLRLMVLTLSTDVIRPEYRDRVLPARFSLLHSVDPSTYVDEMVTALRNNCTSLHSPQTHKLEIVCVLMISCNAYEFNETTVQGYSNSMISGMWRAVTKTSLYLNATSQSVAFIFQTLLNERSDPRAVVLAQNKNTLVLT